MELPITHFHLLGEALECRTLALFLGADLPRALTGIPSRAELARALAHQHGLDERASLARVAQQVGRGGYRREFTVFLREQVAGVAPQPFHRRVAAFVQEHGLQTLITTAYDDLLKRALEAAGIPVECVWKDSQLAVAFPERPLLIQLYGAPLTDVESLVVTEDDHLDLWRDRARANVLDEVRRALQRNTVLFLGYDLSDPDFQLLWREILSRAGDLHRRAFAVWPGLPAAEAGVWADRGIVILEAEPWGLTAGTAPVAPVAELPQELAVAPAAGVPEPVALQRARRALAILEQQAAGFGALHIPVHLQIELEEKRREVAELEAREQSAKLSEPVVDTVALRARLQPLDDVALETLCMDHFPAVYDAFSRGLRRDEKINLLLDHCRRNPPEAARLAALLP